MLFLLLSSGLLHDPIAIQPLPLQRTVLPSSLPQPRLLVAQAIVPAADGTGTVVTLEDRQFNITGGTLSSDRANLFHSFQQFGLDTNQIATFLSQPGIQNILGRVVGGDPSIINGLIQVTGGNSNLYLMNPNGIIFGATASLNIPASFTATTATGIGFGTGWFNAIGPNDYTQLLGNPTQLALTQPGTLINAGTLIGAPGQSITLLGGTVINTGTIATPNGKITIAALPGEQWVRISQEGSLLSLDLPTSSQSPSPLSSPLTLPQLLTGNTLGSSTGLTVDKGTVRLTASDAIVPFEPGTAIVSGTLSVSNPDTPTTGTPSITVVGDRVSLLGATLGASGVNGGGLIRIGGEYQGQGPLPNAQQTFVSADTIIRADALGQGKGGRVIVWADNTTQFAGTITAQGGSQGGDGGFVETSGKRVLDFAAGQVNASAVNGTPGLWFLDPGDITIGAPEATTIQTSLAGGTSLTFNTIGGTGGTGDITLSSPINVTDARNATLTLTASRYITRPALGTATINLTNGNLVLNLNQESLAAEQNPTLTNALNTVGSIRNGTITVNLANGIYREQNPVSIITGNSITINGAGRTIFSGDRNGDGTGDHGVFDISAGTITLNNLTIRDGRVTTTGGGINISSRNATVTLNNSTVSGNSASQNGGGIFNNGTLTLNNSTVSGNSASQNGGGIYINRYATVTLNNSTVSGNSASQNGGGIFNSSTLTLNNSTVSRNSTSQNGGGIFNSGTLTLNNSTVSGNSASGNGGGILSSSGLTLNSSTVSGNSTSGNGGGIFNSGSSPLRLTNSTVSGNSASQNGGGFYNNSSSSVTLTSSTVSGNSASQNGGGFYSRSSSVALVSSTISGNSASTGGGFVVNLKTGVPDFIDLRLSNSTISNNISAIEQSSFDGGGVFNAGKTNLLGSLTISQTSIGLAGTLSTGGQNATFSLPLTLIGNTTIDAGAGSLSLGVINGGVGSLAVSGSQITLTGNINNAGQPIRLSATNGNITATSTGITVSTDSLPGAAGGAITLEASQGAVTVGNLSSVGSTGNGGAIAVTAKSSITTGTINASSFNGSGGTVTLDPEGDVQVTWINAQGSSRGTGGTVSITAGQNFRATGSFTDQTGLSASISTAGGTGGGAITIRHGGGSTTPFVVGDATTNGTAAALTTGSSNQILPTRSFTASFTQGTSPSIQLITGTGTTGGTGAATTTTTVSSTDPLPPRRHEDKPPPPPEVIPRGGISNLKESRELTLLEEKLTAEYVSYLGLSVPPQIKTLEETRQLLGEIELKTGVKPAILYIGFAPTIVRSSKPEEQTGPAIAAKGLGDQAQLFPSNSILQNDRRALDTDQLELLVVTSQGQTFRKRFQDITRKQVMEQVEFLLSTIPDEKAQTDDFKEPAQQLYQWLITPLLPDLRKLRTNNLIFITESGLRAVPMAALYDGKQFLVEQYSIGLVPSISLVDTRYVDIRKAQVLAMGANFIGVPGQVPLYAAPLEVRTIAQQIWQGRYFLNQDFTLENLTRQRQQQPFQILHLATHAEFLPGDLQDSYIQLWDRQLNLKQLNQLKLANFNIDLLVLSACQTALGDPNAELGFSGLAVVSGVRSAMGSLWQVSDLATLGLMQSFYRNLQVNPTKSEALRQAQLALLQGRISVKDGKLWEAGQKDPLPLPPELAQFEGKDLSHPYFWSGFTIVGSPW